MGRILSQAMSWITSQVQLVGCPQLGLWILVQLLVAKEVGQFSTLSVTPAVAYTKRTSWRQFLQKTIQSIAVDRLHGLLCLIQTPI